MNYDTILFDLDGTLLDTLDDLADSVNYALGKYSLPLQDRSKIRSYIGNGAENLIARSVPQGKENPFYCAVFADFRKHYTEHSSDKTRPYPGVPQLVKELAKRHIKMGIVSNKPDVSVKQLKEKFFEGEISVAIGAREGIEKKPAPDTVFAALAELGSTREHTLYIGDSEVDVFTAQNAGIDCLAVTWGFRDKAELERAGAKEIADRTEDVLKKITG